MLIDSPEMDGGTNILGQAIDIQREADGAVSGTETKTMTFAFIPSKIVLSTRASGRYDGSTEDGIGIAECIITRTGVDTITYVSDSQSFYQFTTSGDANKYSILASTTKVFDFRLGYNSGDTDYAAMNATATWDDATKTLSIALGGSNLSLAASEVQFLATAYK